MARIVIEVMPKVEILDPQGKAITAALASAGHADLGVVRAGKRFELEVPGEVSDELLAKARELAENLFANPNIEDVTGVYVAQEA